MTNQNDKILAVVCIILLISSIILFSYINTDEEETVDETLIATREYAKDVNKYITAEVLYDRLNDDNATNDPFIVSIRSAEHYAIGHITGSINIPLNTLFTKENLAKLPDAEDQQIVVVCYTGHTAAQATALLNVDGYDALCLKWGMCSWTADTNVTFGNCYNDKEDSHDWSVEAGVITTNGGNSNAVGNAVVGIIYPRVEPLVALGGCGDVVAPSDTGPALDLDASETDSLSTAIHLSLNQGIPAVITAKDLYNNLLDGNSQNDPFILSVRDVEDYKKGHIRGAVNIEIAELFTDEGLQKLPGDKDQRIIVVCYTGHTASQTAALLNLNGYNATALKWGMSSWTLDHNVLEEKHYYTQPTVNYPVDSYCP